MNNRIFVGPPGSGKTYGAKYEVVKTIWNLMDEEEKNKKNSRYYNPKNFCEEAFLHVERNYHPGIRLASLHEGMTTSDLIEGLSVETSDGITVFANSDKMVLNLLEEMKKDDKPGFLILDDIHRVNIVGVLGELLFAFSHRGETVTLSTGRKICVPENLYVYFTMNTLRPDFSIDSSIFEGFQTTYMNSDSKRLDKAVDEGYYSSAYYNIDSEIVDQLIEIQKEYREIVAESKSSGVVIEKANSIEKIFDIDMGCVFSSFQAQLFLDVTFPVSWEKRTDIQIKFRKKYNDVADQFCKKLNEAYEQYSKFYSLETLDLLDQFKHKVLEEYSYYNRYLDYIAPEYYQDKTKYEIGYTYFLPGHGFSMWNAFELLQNKIRAQVIPLLKQYGNDGIIVGCSLPDVQRTATSFTREISRVGEEKIEIITNDEYRDIFLDLYGEKKSTKNVKNPMNRSQLYNPTSGSERMRKKINKLGSSDDVITVSKEILENGIDLKGYFIYGFPEETKEDFQKTYELASKIKEISLKTPGTFRTSVFQFRPYHGTQLYNEIVKSTGIIHGCEFNKSISQFEGRSQFNFEFGNYSAEIDEMLNEYIIKTQKLTEEEQ